MHANRRSPPVVSILPLLCAAAIVLGAGCGDSTAPSLRVGTFDLKLTTGAASYRLGGDSAIWVTTGLNLFNAQLVTDAVVPGIPAPIMFFIGLKDSSLAFAALPPGNYHVSLSDTTLLGGAPGPGVPGARRQRQRRGDNPPLDASLRGSRRCLAARHQHGHPDRLPRHRPLLRGAVPLRRSVPRRLSPLRGVP